MIRTMFTPLRSGSMTRLPHGIVEKVYAHAGANFVDVEDLPPVATLAGGIHLATQLAPQQTSLGVGNAGEPRLLQRPDCLCVVPNDACADLGIRPAMIPKECRAESDDRVHLRVR